MEPLSRHDDHEATPAGSTAEPSPARPRPVAAEPSATPGEPASRDLPSPRQAPAVERRPGEARPGETRPGERPSLYARTRAAVRAGGVRYAVGRGLRRLTSPLVETGTLVVFVRDLEGPLPAPPGGGGFEVREASPAETGDLLAGCDPGRSAETLLERFRRGHACFAVSGRDGRPAHTRWVTTEPPYIPEVRRHLLLAPGDAYFYDGFTRPDARGRGLDGIARCAIFRALRDRGFRRAVSYVRADNPVGLRAAGRWQQPVGRVRYLRLAGSAPRLLGAEVMAPLAFSRQPAFEDDEEVRAARARSWRQWFDGWLAQPLEKRSTGFSNLPREYFTATGAFIAEVLDLDSDADSVLDVGCDSAAVSRWVAPRCRRLTGFDLVAGQVRDSSRLDIRCAAGEAPRFFTADARLQPLPAGAFDKAYCISVIHTLPTHEDGFRVIREMVRVCRPGGRILVGGVPDRSLHRRGRAERWKRGSWRQRLEIAASLLLPAPVKGLLRRALGLPPPLVYLEYDLPALSERVRELGVDCRVVPFPEDFWSVDFRTTRSNLLITLPGR